MEQLLLIGTVFLTHVLVLVSPGPDFLVVLRNSLTYSRKIGIFTALGIGFGLLLHLFYSFAGIAFLISQSVLLFTIVQVLGASYLIYMGISCFFTENLTIKVEQKEQKEISIIKALRVGFLTNILNPKATLYFLSIFSLIIKPKITHFLIFLISFIVISISILWFVFVSIFITQPKIKKIFDRFQKFFNRIFGIVLVGIGIKIFFSIIDKI